MKTKLEKEPSSLPSELIREIAESRITNTIPKQLHHHHQMKSTEQILRCSPINYLFGNRNTKLILSRSQNALFINVDKFNQYRCTDQPKNCTHQTNEVEEEEQKKKQINKQTPRKVESFKVITL